jgi:hypothetical protein
MHGQKNIKLYDSFHTFSNLPFTGHPDLNIPLLWGVKRMLF